MLNKVKLTILRWNKTRLIFEEGVSILELLVEDKTINEN